MYLTGTEYVELDGGAERSAEPLDQGRVIELAGRGAIDGDDHIVDLETGHIRCSSGRNVNHPKAAAFRVAELGVDAAGRLAAPSAAASTYGGYQKEARGSA